MTLTAPVVPGTVVRESEKPPFFWMLLWCLFVLGVQPWSSRVAAPQGTTGSTNSLLKGMLLGAIFLVVLAATKPGFRTRISPVTTLYVGYALCATATTFLLADPVGPLLRLARLLVGLVLLFMLWRPLIQTPERLVRAHLWAHLLLAATIVLSVAYAPGQAWRPLSSFGTGYRLQGVIIPMLPPRVGEVGAILFGLAVIALVARKLRFIPATALIGLGLVLVALSRTRTAAAAIAFGLFLALLLTRKTWFGRLLALGVPGLVGLIFMTVPALHTWLLRGQGTRQITSLSGRTTSWQAVLEEEVSLQTAIIGHGLGNKRVLLRRGEGDIDVMAIDNSWLGLYWETGLLAVAIVGIAVVVAWVAVLRAPTPYVKACGALLLGYVSAASLNESGLSDLSSMTLHLLVAAAICDSDRLRNHARLTQSPPIGPSTPPGPNTPPHPNTPPALSTSRRSNTPPAPRTPVAPTPSTLSVPSPTREPLQAGPSATAPPQAAPATWHDTPTHVLPAVPSDPTTPSPSDHPTRPDQNTPPTPHQIPEPPPTPNDLPDDARSRSTPTPPPDRTDFRGPARSRPTPTLPPDPSVPRPPTLLGSPVEHFPYKEDGAGPHSTPPDPNGPPPAAGARSTPTSPPPDPKKSPRRARRGRSARTSPPPDPGGLPQPERLGPLPTPPTADPSESVRPARRGRSASTSLSPDSSDLPRPVRGGSRPRPAGAEPETWEDAPTDVLPVVPKHAGPVPPE